MQDQTAGILDKQRIVAIVDVDDTGVEGLVLSGDDDRLIRTAGQVKPIVAELIVVFLEHPFELIVQFLNDSSGEKDFFIGFERTAKNLGDGNRRVAQFGWKINGLLGKVDTDAEDKGDLVEEDFR